ncbi:galactose mutarotase-like domain-containing protein [Xylaria bambusicola]|uniref:galactose mutarotase-like domain-containing protein n=1 Tax=Xylaria bambusicola TaxID=326684 RepID=UPI002008912C|nr:galactose mutarotase-like domain-containing protein [Xylaria bambusicola]KAI0516945.1 galactose mutarotase-like domain-containing protein [Xylaria bambusicola]
MDNEVSFLPLGAIIQSFTVNSVNIVQGFPTQELYESHNSPYFGETIGRVANRISNAKLASVNGGNSYNLPANDGSNTLHGGVKGWGKRIWDGPKATGAPKPAGQQEGGDSVQFTLRSEDGDEGFPGEVLAKVTYTAAKHKEGGGDTQKEVTLLNIEYEAELVSGAEETVINMTNHSYFNLTGGPSIEGTEVQLCTPSYLPVDDGGIPTGGPTTYAKVATNEKFTLGPQEPDIDDCFVVDPSASPASVPIDTRDRPLVVLVKAYHPDSKIHLEVHSTEPAFQFYTGKYINVPAVEGVPARNARSGFCVEPSRFVNACNVDDWKNQMLLKKGEKYGCRILYKAWQD